MICPFGSCPLPEKLALLARAIRDPDLEVYSTTQPLPLSGQPGADQAEAAFFQSVDCLADWGVLPQSFDPDTLEFQGGSRAGLCRGRQRSVRQHAVSARRKRQPGQFLAGGG